MPSKKDKVSIIEIDLNIDLEEEIKKVTDDVETIRRTISKVGDLKKQKILSKKEKKTGMG